MASIQVDGSNSPEPQSMSISSSLHTPNTMLVALPASQGTEGDKGWEQNSTEVEEQITPRKSVAAPGGLLPPFGVSHASHLPTPQSPGNVDSYASTLVFPPESPLPQSMHSERISASQYIAQHSSISEDRAATQSFMTPESSPIFSRKTGRTNDEAWAPVNSAVSVLSSPFTPRPSSKTETTASATTKSTSEPRTPPLSRQITPSSRLSSPFMERLSLTDRSRSRTKTPVRSHVVSPHDHGSPIHVDRPLSPEPSTSKTPPPLSAPIPQRATGGEIQRIRLQMAADQAARVSEMEARRPDYLVREKRLSLAPEPVGVDEFDFDEQETLIPGLGVTISPVKGRRIQLFQETSEESFEQSLLAGGYPGYGSTTAPEPQTPANNGKTALSQRALQWLQQATPGQPSPANMVVEPDEDWVPSEKEIRKRKRLAAFEDQRENLQPPAKLHPVVIEGKGRVLLNVPPEEVPPHFQTPTKKRGNNRRRKRGGVHTSASKRGYGDQQVDDAEIQGPNWVDSAFPWCMRSQERTEMARLEQEERLKRIERYLERDSESDEDDIVEDQALHPIVQSEDEAGAPPRRGRGKMVPLNANPGARRNGPARSSVLVPSDPADARAALLSKRSVRALAFRRRQERERDDDDDEDLDEEVLCICRRGDDGRPLVQCDDCHTWYHLACVGIRHSSELGEEEDPWYCPECLGIPMSDPPSEPTFVPTDDKPPVDGRRDPLFYQGSLQESPSNPWTSSQDPKTPTRGRDFTQTFASRSSWGDSSQPGPSTPVSSAQPVRVYTTPPGPFDTFNFDSPFDPSKTPSRGVKSGAPFTTPKNQWSSRLGEQTQTPGLLDSNIWRTSGGSFSFGNLGSNNVSPGGPLRNIYSLDDTPIRRSVPKEHLASSFWGKRLWDSPLPARSAHSTRSSRQDSPGTMYDDHVRKMAAVSSRPNESS